MAERSELYSNLLHPQNMGTNGPSGHSPAGLTHKCTHKRSRDDRRSCRGTPRHPLPKSPRYAIRSQLRRLSTASWVRPSLRVLAYLLARSPSQFLRSSRSRQSIS